MIKNKVLKINPSRCRKKQTINLFICKLNFLTKKNNNQNQQKFRKIFIYIYVYIFYMHYN